MKKVLPFIGLFLLVAFFYVLLFQRDSWQSCAQTILHFPLYTLAWLLITKRLSLLAASVLAWISYFSAEHGLIDEKFHNFLEHAEFYKLYFQHEANPQYAKLVLFAIAISAMFVLLLFKKNRSEDRIFAAIGVVASLIATAFIHHAVPGTMLKWRKEISKNSLTRVLQMDLEKKEFDRACTLFELICYDQLTGAEAQLKVSNIPLPAVVGEISTKESGRFYDYEWILMNVAIKNIGSQKYQVAIDEKFLNESQKLSEEAFGKLESAAVFTWGWLIFLLGPLHRFKKRRIIFSVPDRP